MTVESGGSWPVSLAEYIRHNDQIIIEQADKMLSTFEEELIPCESFDEFCDVAGKAFLVLFIQTVTFQCMPLQGNVL